MRTQILKQRVCKRRPGIRVVTVELKPGEQLITVDESQFYRMGGQVQDIVPGYVLVDSNRVIWDHHNQEWDLPR